MTKNIILLMLVIFIFNGCSTRVKINGGGICHIEEWHINPNKEESRRLGSSSKDYGASAEKLRGNYIIKRFLYDDNSNQVEIPESELWKIECSKKTWTERQTKEEYQEEIRTWLIKGIPFTIFADEDQSDEAKLKKIEELKKMKGISKVSVYVSSRTRAEYMKWISEPEIKGWEWEDNPNRFIYTKDEKGIYHIKETINCPPARSYRELAIEKCSGEWCKVLCLTSTPSVYVKKEAVYK